MQRPLLLIFAFLYLSRARGIKEALAVKAYLSVKHSAGTSDIYGNGVKIGMIDFEKGTPENTIKALLKDFDGFKAPKFATLHYEKSASGFTLTLNRNKKECVIVAAGREAKGSCTKSSLLAKKEIIGDIAASVSSLGIIRLKGTRRDEAGMASIEASAVPGSEVDVFDSRELQKAIEFALLEGLVIAYRDFLKL